MARYVVLSFDNNDDADAFVSSVEHHTAFFARQHGDGNGHFEHLSEDVFVRGVYMKPTLFCTCRQEGKWAKQDGWARGKKYGLYVHNRCGKPSKAWAVGDHWFATHGVNLLPVSEQAPEWRGIGVAHHRWDGANQQWVHVETGKVWDGKLPSDTP